MMDLEVIDLIYPLVNAIGWRKKILPSNVKMPKHPSLIQPSTIDPVAGTVGPARKRKASKKRVPFLFC